MSTWRRLVLQGRYQLISFWRDPTATFFTVVLPLIFLVLFTSIFGNNTIGPPEASVRVATFYVPGILALSVISATFQNLALRMVGLREGNLLKRIRGTPLQPALYIAGHVLAAVVLAVIMTVLVIAVGWLAFDVSVQADGIPALAITLALGTATFSCLGFALAAIIPSEKSSGAMVQAVSLPLFFVSDVFIPPTDDRPQVLELIGDLFPIKHTANALFDAFDPFSSGTPMPWGHWAVIAGWGAVGLYVALTKFRWSKVA